MTIMEALEATYEEMVVWRRHLHQYPELSFKEDHTAAFVEEKLRQWGLDVRTKVGQGHGILAKLEGGLGRGSTVALRADMDALPIHEENDCEYASKVPGVMHACGHDAHTATLLAVAKALSECRGEWAGTVVFLFQHAEEMTPGGAAPMIADGALEGVDVVYGVHLWSPLEAGTAWCKEGPIMAAADEFIIDVLGRGGHGGLPHETIDAVYIASQLVVSLQSIVSRSADPTQPCVVSVGSIHSGSTFNVIAETAQLKGTVRTFDGELRNRIRERLETIVAQTCSMHGARYRIDYKLGYPPVVNHEAEAERFVRAAPKVFGEEGTQRSPLIMAAEDYAYYLEQVPGCFMLVGAGSKERGIVHPHHHPRFDIEEKAMLHAAKLFVTMTMDYLAEHSCN
ncbi:M20 family metallopeptidase [Paenibacillus sp. YYML68]|uniref:M20 family metallopeptidase n=1 Tax=Paenibacillus sp. YYML68 TaxID=2909250 RepID=UPI0024928EF1|nr:M20 family metallopeptidase [Paenibacillus sp. YYML68]